MTSTSVVFFPDLQIKSCLLRNGELGVDLVCRGCHNYPPSCTAAHLVCLLLTISLLNDGATVHRGPKDE